MAQRLVRRICGDCKEEVTYDEEQLGFLKMSDEELAKMTFHRGAGCDSCGGSGYRGRQGLYEVMSFSPELRRLILKEASTAEIQEQADSIIREARLAAENLKMRIQRKL